MIAFKKDNRCRKSPPGWHAGFEKMLPVIETHARVTFRHWDPEALEELVQATICLACQAYARLFEQGRAHVTSASALARFSVLQALDGRKVGGELNLNDISSEYCQRRRNLLVERLSERGPDGQDWSEILTENRKAGPAETAIIRVDFATWLKLLAPRYRRIANFLGSGETTSAAAKRFRVTHGRISQIRGELRESWHRFQGDQPAFLPSRPAPRRANIIDSLLKPPVRKQQKPHHVPLDRLDGSLGPSQQA